MKNNFVTYTYYFFLWSAMLFIWEDTFFSILDYFANLSALAILPKLHKLTLVIFLFFISGFHKKYTKYGLYLFSFCFFTTAFLALAKHASFGGWYTDIKNAFKTITPLLFFASCVFFERYIPKEKLIKDMEKVFIACTICIVFNIVMGSLGYGYQQYNDGTGTSGFIPAGNELSGLFLTIIYPMFILLRHYSLFFKGIFSIMALLVALSLATKVAVLGMLLFIGFFLKIRPLYAIGSGILLLIVGITYFSETILNNNFLARLHFFYQKADFLTFILSKRNVYLVDIWNTVIPQFEAIHYLFGIGSFQMEQIAEQTDIKYVAEMDIFDIFFQLGSIGISYFVMQWTFFFKVIYRRIFFHKLFLLVVLTISIISGHIFFSGILGPYLGITIWYLTNKKID